MKKRWIYSAVTAAGAGAAMYVLRDEKKRNELKERAKSLTTTVQNSIQKEDDRDLPVEKAGVPEFDHTENTKMVDEGSQFGVQYYNELQEKEKELEKQNT
ncbi:MULTISPECIES: hypothetical protein [Pontibacillus]|uniref:YtxH domain-containing protein n=1 Tax=Pontibacillus chungwhensis TaxID=265426 RepID=A0ABY8V1L6_9BACI|nr:MULTISPECIES: hypothetical protein [Pontibacillus]MCD5322540.1 hypothetical protein [Pontibacillus sp. HN14]WIF99825.1 hypothetical protein QNI29_09245 [Pontibacillus chungwhensis]